MLREFISALILITLFAVGSIGQELEFSGYYENQLTVQELREETYLQDTNKLRLDLSAEVSENVSFTADYVYRTYHGETEFNAFDFIPDSVIADYADEMQVPVDSLRPEFAFEYEDENFLDNAYVTIYLQKATIRVGKQQLPWGSGYTWNPTDVFNEKDILDPTYEKPGVEAYKLEVPFGGEGMLTGILSPGDDWAASTKAAKVKQHFLGFDLSVSFVEKQQNDFDYFTFTESAERRRLYGGDFSGELFGLGVWGEGAYNQMEDRDNYGQYLIGLDYTFESELYVMVEFYRNELGDADKDAYDINDWMRLLDADGENLAQDYVFLGQRYPLTELLNWSNYVMCNINDGSGIFYPWFDYSFNDNTELNLVGLIPWGETDSEFGESGVGGFFRVKIYF
jgi:hypothetical protein